MNSKCRSLISALKSCKDLQTGRSIHAQVLQSPANDRLLNIYVSNSLINMYANCGSMADARAVFDRIPCHNIVSWNSLILGYGESSQEDLALELFSQIHPAFPTALTFVSAFKACIGRAAREETTQICGKLIRKQSLETAMRIHSQAAAAGLLSDVFLATTLISLYAKCGSLVDARMVFDTMELRNVVAWNALLLGYAEGGEADLALELFRFMRLNPEEDCQPNASSFVAAFKACGSLGRSSSSGALDKAVNLHCEAAKRDLEGDVFVACSLVSLYAKCGSMEESRKVFDGIFSKTVVAWNALLAGYVDNGEEERALQIFWRMKPEVCSPNALTFVAALKACANLADLSEEESKTEFLETASQIHREAAKFGFEGDVFLASTLVSTYAKCGSMANARRVFDRIRSSRNSVAWNALLLGYVENDEAEVVLDLFNRMRSEGCLPDSRSFLAALKACSILAAKEEGRQVEGNLLKVISLENGVALHSQASAAGLDSGLFVASSLVEMYAKCGSMGNASKVFDGMSFRDVVTWTALILGYAENKSGELALEAFARMAEEGCVAPDARTYAAALKACSGSVKFISGREIHAAIYRAGVEIDHLLVHCLVEFYAKCGSVVDAQQVFDSLSLIKDLKTWTALLAGYSRQADSQRVFEIFSAMVCEGLRPDGVTLLCVLSACSHGGLVEKAREIFGAMKGGRYDGVEAAIEHYHCMVDVLGRGNRLDEALEMIREMPFRPNAVTWMTVLGACEKWKNVEVGRIAFGCLVEMGVEEQREHSSAIYSLMGNICSF